MKHSKVHERENTALKDALGNILHSAAYSDMKIHLSDGTEITCHRAIVCERCDFFKNALQSGFKETHSGIVEMLDDPPEAVRAMISYLYTADYPDNGLVGTDLGLFHVDVYIIAATYLIDGLAHIARVHLWNSFVGCSVSFPDVANALRECSLRFGKLHETEKFYNEVVEYTIEIHLDLEFDSGEGYIKAMKMEYPEFAHDVTEKAWRQWKTSSDHYSASWLDFYGGPCLEKVTMMRNMNCPRGCGSHHDRLSLPKKKSAPKQCWGCGNFSTSAQWVAGNRKRRIESEEDTESDSDFEDDRDGNRGAEENTERNNGSEEDTEDNSGFAEDSEIYSDSDGDRDIYSDSEGDRESDSGSEEGFESYSDEDEDTESD